MTPAALLAILREATPTSCQSSGCSKPGCFLPIARSLRPFMLVDLDAAGSPAGPHETRCDFLFFGAAGDSLANAFRPAGLGPGAGQPEAP